MKSLKLSNLMEEVQDYIAANSALGYTVGENFTLENALDVQDFKSLVGAKVTLTLYDEGIRLISSGSQTGQERDLRFVTKGLSEHEALESARDLLEWLWNHKTFETTGYRVWVLRLPVPPSILARDESQSCLANFVMTILALNKV